MQPKRQSVLVSLVLPLLLTACAGAVSADTRVTLLTGERWEVRIEVVVTPEQDRLLAAQIGQSLDDLASEMRAEGLGAGWERDDRRDDGNVAYVISAEGHGLDELSTGFFNDEGMFRVDESSGARQIVFGYSPSDLLSAQRQTFTLRGGRIISSNGAPAGRGTVTWTNPTERMEAVLTEASPTAWLPYALVGAGAVLVVVAGVGVARTRRRDSLPGVPAPALGPGSYCSACGMALPETAVFCPGCGRRRMA